MKGKIVQFVVLAAFIVSVSLIFPVDIAIVGTALLLVILLMISLLNKKITRTEKFANEILKKYEQTFLKQFQAKEKQASDNPSGRNQPSHKRDPATQIIDEAEQEEIILAINTETAKKQRPPKKKHPRNTGKNTAGDETFRTAANPYLKKRNPVPDDNDLKNSKRVQPVSLESEENTEENLFSDELDKMQENNQAFEGVLNPITANEILSNEDLRPHPEELEEQAKTILEKVHLALNQKDYQDALDTIQSWIDFNQNTVADAPQYFEIIFLKGKSELLLKSFNEAAKTWKKYFNESKSEEALQQKSAEISAFIESADNKKLVLPVMFTLLDYYRSKMRFDQMDKIYEKMIDVYRGINDRKNLMPTYQSQLSVKKKLKDFDGQLHILDMLGKLYFDEGDKKTSRLCYQESIKIRSEMLTAKNNKTP